MLMTFTFASIFIMTTNVFFVKHNNNHSFKKMCNYNKQRAKINYK